MNLKMYIFSELIDLHPKNKSKSGYLYFYETFGIFEQKIADLAKIPRFEILTIVLCKSSILTEFA